MNRVFITGVSGYFGSKLVEHLGGKDDVGEIIGIDLTQPRAVFEKYNIVGTDDLEQATARQEACLKSLTDTKQLHSQIDCAKNVHGAAEPQPKSKKKAKDFTTKGTKNTKKNRKV